MSRIFFISLMLLGIIYFLPVTNNYQHLEEGYIPVLSEFSIGEIINSQEINEYVPESIIVQIDSKNVEIDIDEFLVGVVSAEMPASFETEALKAQAVAARTYIYYKQWLVDNGIKDSKHPTAVVCTDHTHCKAYIDIYAKNPWGNSYEIYKTKMENAVYSTQGQYVVYEQEPIAAVFHSTSSENTESAVDVWGNEVPYLQAVVSEGSENSPSYKSSRRVSISDFKKIVLAKYSKADFSSSQDEWIKDIVRSDSGGIVTAKIGGITIKGTDIRTMFSLNSTNFSVSFDEGYIVFDTTGYGHGVGLSQYGANYLASEGKNYRHILLWYYQGTQIAYK